MEFFFGDGITWAPTVFNLKVSPTLNPFPAAARMETQLKIAEAAALVRAWYVRKDLSSSSTLSPKP